MLLSKKKIQLIHGLFTTPYKPTLKIILSQNEKIFIQSNEFKYSKLPFKSINNTSSVYHKNTKEIRKSSFPVYYKKNNPIKPVNFINNTYNTINYDAGYYSNYYPLKRDIIIKNPEEIIQSGVLKGPTRQNQPIFQDNQNNEIISQDLNNLKYTELKNNDKKSEEVQEPELISQKIVEDAQNKEEELRQKEINLNEIESINSVKKPEVKGTDDEIQEKNIDSQNLNKEVDLKQSAEIHSKESHGDLEDDIEGE